MANQGCFDGSGAACPRGFSLIEILVVVAIIALLLSILLPSLSQARGQARSMACSSHLGQLARAEGLYQAQNREWIPGSPLTTGYYWTMTANPIYGPQDSPLASFNRLSLNLFDWNTPLRSILHGPGSIPRGTGTNWLSTQKQLWSRIFEGVFACPSNAERYGPYDAAGFPIIHSASYLTMSTFMRAGSDVYDSPIPGARISKDRYSQSRNWEVFAGDGYRPRHARLTRESIKVFLADGFRFYDAGGATDYDPSTIGIYGAFTASNPPAVNPPAPAPSLTYGREYGLARRFSYRHRGNRAINAAFFDGHVEQLFVDFRGLDPHEVGYSGSAVDPRYWFPAGTTVAAPAVFHKQGLDAGAILR